MLGLLELGARFFSNAILMGDSAHLFDTSDKDYFTNCKSCEAISFGTKIYTNKDGFRVSKLNVNKPFKKEKRIIIIGDSVAFAPGIKFNNSFQGLLEAKYPDYQFENRSVIGHDIEHHLKTAQNIIKNPLFINKVYLVYCLNDISNESSYEIQKINSKSLDSSSYNYIDHLKKNKFSYSLNSFLRSKSVFYMYLKGILTNPSKRYFEQDLKKYKQANTISSLNKLGEIAQIFNSYGIQFVVLIAPYEYQIREGENNNQLLLPQINILKYLNKNQINNIDLYSTFKNFSQISTDLYLGYDPMHFSAKGHQILFDVISSDIIKN